MPLLKITKEEYEALYRKALYFLRTGRIKNQGLDHHETVQYALEVYFMKRYLRQEFSLEDAINESINNKDSCSYRHRSLSYAKDITDLDINYDNVEARKDLDVLYLYAHQGLSREEKLVFCKLMQDLSLDTISDHLQISLVGVINLYESLIGKLRHAVTSTTGKEKGHHCRFVGTLRQKSRLFH